MPCIPFRGEDGSHGLLCISEYVTAVGLALAGLWFLVILGHWPGVLLLLAGGWQAWEVVKTRRTRRRWRRMQALLEDLRRQVREGEGCARNGA